MPSTHTNFPQYAFASFILMSTILTHQSLSRELRPSDHGLSFQEHTLPPAQSADGQEMLTFFGSSDIPLPEAKNISDTWMGAHGDARTLDSRRDHVKVGLLVASAVCGLTGVVLLVVSGIIFLFRLHNHKRKPEAAEGSIETSTATATATATHAAAVKQ